MDNAVGCLTAHPRCIFSPLGFSFESLSLNLEVGISIMNQIDYHLIMLQCWFHLVCGTVKRSKN